MAYYELPNDRLILYIATAGGFASSVQAVAQLGPQAAGSPLLGAGVYRRTLDYHVTYLPVIKR